MRKPLIVGFAGGSGSGKTTSIQMLYAQCSELELLIMSQDHYYRDLSHMPEEERSLQNFDHPDAIDSQLLIQHLRELSSGRAIKRPTYDFVSHSRLTDNFELIEPGKVILFDGIFGLHFKELRNLFDLSFFVDVPSDLRLGRRIKRDMKNRGRTVEAVIDQYNETVRPMHDNFIRPSKVFADEILPWESRNMDLVLKIKKQILELIEKGRL